MVEEPQSDAVEYNPDEDGYVAYYGEGFWEFYGLGDFFASLLGFNCLWRDKKFVVLGLRKLKWHFSVCLIGVCLDEFLEADSSGRQSS